MNQGGTIVVAMQRLLDLFVEHCNERTTLEELRQLLLERNSWRKAHDLFQRIRLKTLEATRQGDHLLEAQYLFEEICAKTIYNLSGQPAPFDADSPYWIVPTAFGLARKLRLEDREIIQIIAH
jgi:hypothetical protein